MSSEQFQHGSTGGKKNKTARTTKIINGKHTSRLGGLVCVCVCVLESYGIDSYSSVFPTFFLASHLYYFSFFLEDINFPTKIWLISSLRFLRTCKFMILSSVVYTAEMRGLNSALMLTWVFLEKVKRRIRRL